MNLEQKNMSQKAERLKNEFTSCKRMLGDISTFSKMYLCLTCIHIIIDGMIPLLNVFIPRIIIDSVMSGRTHDAGMAVLWFFLINSVYILTNQAFSAYFDVKNKMFRRHSELRLMRKIMEMDYRNIELAQTHEQKEEARRGIENIFAFMDNIRLILSGILTLTCATYLISFLNIFIAILIFFVVLFNAVNNYKRIQNDINREQSFADLNRKWGYLNYLCRDLANAKEIRFHHLSGWLSKKISGFVQDHQSIIRDSFHNTSVTRRLTSFSYAIQKCIVYIYVGLQLLRKTITAGEFTQYISAVELISTSLVSIISALLEIRKNHKLADRYYNFLDICDKEATAISLKSGMVTEKTASQSGIKIRDVWFRYAEGEDYVLKGLSLYISEGETLSMVGRNGCGKTTLIKLILRLCQPERGVILLNGKNIYEYDYDEYCKLFSVIFQDFKIFSFTVLDNILMEDMPFDPVAPKLSSKQQHRVDEAIRKADFVSAIEHMPNGIYNYINKNYVIDGYELSGGMQQTLAMCRAYYRDAGCIILDEPTAMLDASSESKIYENFNSLIGNKTAIYISHRMSSSRFCDHIAYIENGIVQEYGTHDELIHLNGLYATLFQTQAKLFEQNSV